jgi:hypothetical protein
MYLGCKISYEKENLKNKYAFTSFLNSEQCFEIVFFQNSPNWMYVVF